MSRTAIILVAALASSLEASGAEPLLRLDSVGDPLPVGAIARLGSARLRHTDAVRDVAFSPDGTMLAVTSADGTLWLWDADTGRLIRRAVAGQYSAVAFGSGGKTVATFGPEVGFRVFDPNTGKVVQAVSSDLPVGGRDVAVGRQPAPVLAHGLKWLAYRAGERDKYRILVVDPVTGRQAANLPLRHHGWVTLVEFSSDGSRMVVGDGESGACTIWVFDPQLGKPLFEQKINGLYPRAVSLNRDGTRVAAAALPHAGPVKPYVRVWDVASGKLLLDYPINRHSFRAATLSPDGKTAAILEDYALAFVDVETGRIIRTLRTRWKDARLFFSPNGQRVAVSCGNRIELLDPASGRRVPDLESFDMDFRYDHPSGQVRFLPNGKILARSVDDTSPSIWDPRSGRRLETIVPPPECRYIHEVSPDGRRLVYASGTVGQAPTGEVRIWDRETKADVASARFPGILWPWLAFTSDGRRLFLYTEFGTEVSELNPATLARLRQFELKGGPFNRNGGWGAKYSADGLIRFEMPTSTSEMLRGTVRHWNLATGNEGTAIRWAPETTLSTTENYLGEVR